MTPIAAPMVHDSSFLQKNQWESQKFTPYINKEQANFSSYIYETSDFKIKKHIVGGHSIICPTDKIDKN